MKLNPEFITHEMAGSHITVPVGSAAEKFRGIIKSNETAAFIIECLKSDTTADAIVDKMLEVYEVERDVAAAGVEKGLAKLRELDALE